MRKTFFDNNESLLTVMLQNPNKDCIIETINKANELGAEAYGLQLEVLDPQYRNNQDYLEILGATNNLPVYITNYQGKNDELRSENRITTPFSGILK